MSFSSGHKLAHYEILEPIGKGGMGEVYRARDGKLGRDVAIKVLPDEFAQNTERLRRFQREAKILASLNHPNIAAIYGVEQSGSTHYLVLELVPGETLAERIARGPIPVDEAIEIAMKIVEALEEAHQQGIVHRDLKPANIKITPDGKVKVLDFGLYGGGTKPLWSPDGRELFYLTPGGRLMAVRIQTEPRFATGKPEVIFEPRYYASASGRTYDVSPDGERFLMIKQGGSDETSTTELILVLNWFEELKQRVPTDN